MARQIKITPDITPRPPKGVTDDGHYNHMPKPHKRISMSLFMEKLLCSPTSQVGHETRQIGEAQRKLTKTHIWWFESFGLAVQIRCRSQGHRRDLDDADLVTEDWGFRFYYLGCEHKWKVTKGSAIYDDHFVLDQVYTCPLCGAVKRWDSS